MATPSLEPTVLRACWRSRRLIALFALIGAALFLVIAILPGKQYTASALLPLQQQQLDVAANATAQDPSTYVTDQIAFLQSRDVANATIKLLRARGLAEDLKPKDFTNVTSVKRAIDAGAGTNDTTNVLNLSFKSDEERGAGLGLTDWVKAYNEVRAASIKKTADIATQSLTDAIEGVNAELATTQRDIENQNTSDPNAPALQALLLQQQRQIQRKSDLQASVDQLQLQASLASSGTTLGTTVEATTPTTGELIRDAILGAIIGAVIGGVVAYLIALRRRRFEAPGQPELLFRAPLLGEVFVGARDLGTVPTLEPIPDGAADAFGVAAVALGVHARRDANVVVALCSTSDAESRPTVIANLAIAMAQERQRVLLLDAAARDGYPASSIVAAGVGAEEVEGSATFTFEGGGVLTVLRYESSDTSTDTDAMVADHEVVLLDVARRLSGETALGLATVDRAIVVIESGSSIDAAEALVSDLRALGTKVVGYLYCERSRSASTRFGTGLSGNGARSGSAALPAHDPARLEVSDGV